MDVKLLRTMRPLTRPVTSEDADILILPDNPYERMFPGQPMIRQSGHDLLKILRQASVKVQIDDSKGIPEVIKQANLELAFPEILVTRAGEWLSALVLSVLANWIWERIRAIRKGNMGEDIIAEVKVGFIEGNRIVSYRLRGRAERVVTMLRDTPLSEWRSNVSTILDFDEQPGSGIVTGFSIGAIVRQTTCSICGQDYYFGNCDHVRGRRYGGKECTVRIDKLELVEVSLVPTPANLNARIIYRS